MTADPHICTCGDCAVGSFDDRCKYEAALGSALALLRDVYENGLDSNRTIEPNPTIAEFLATHDFGEQGKP